MRYVMDFSLSITVPPKGTKKPRLPRRGFFFFRTGCSPRP
jgi:hypothetical protein